MPQPARIEVWTEELMRSLTPLLPQEHQEAARAAVRASMTARAQDLDRESSARRMAQTRARRSSGDPVRRGG